jgi:hypothetical protein
MSYLFNLLPSHSGMRLLLSASTFAEARKITEASVSSQIQRCIEPTMEVYLVSWFEMSHDVSVFVCSSMSPMSTYYLKAVLISIYSIYIDIYSIRHTHT